MANWEKRARAYARKYGIPPELFIRQMRQESGLNPNARSPAGAQGIAQIMPFHDVRPDLPGHQRAGKHPEWDLNWAARHDAENYRKYGNYKDMLSVYNSGRPWKEGRGISETRGYVTGILEGHTFGKPSRGGRGAPVQPQTPSRMAAQTTGNDSEAFKKLVAQSLLQRASTGEREPGFLMGLALQREQVGAANQALGAASPRMLPQAPTGAPIPGPGNWKKWVQLSPARGNTSHRTRPAILRFVAGIGRTVGHPLPVWDNTTHSKMTVNGNVSAHYDGNAADIPSSGKALGRLGYTALRRAGMGEKEARRAQRTGGLFNVGGYQVIFNTSEGGNHYDHLHVGIRR